MSLLDSAADENERKIQRTKGGLHKVNVYSTCENMPETARTVNGNVKTEFERF
jgi:hypothetical protein